MEEQSSLSLMLQITSYNAPLFHMVALTGQKDKVQLLLDFGADVNGRYLFGKAPLTYAVKRGQIKIANLLKENGGTE